MEFTIEAMKECHRAPILAMMRTFYASPAVLSNGSEEIFAADIDECVSDNPYLEGFVFCRGDVLVGYGMAAKSFSTEFGKPCIWIEDLYVRPEYRGQGIGSAFLEFMTRRYPSAILRLEVEEENERAIAVYRKSGFRVLPYMEMKKE
jgi:ribosomal protein S18 acetylase RimI-like enzyme